MEEEKDEALLEFITDDDSYEYLERLFTCIEEDLIDCYTMSIEDDENEIDDFVCYVLRFGKPIKSDTVESVIEDLLISTKHKNELLDFVNKITNTGKYFELYKKYFGKQANSLHPEVFLGNTNAFLERIADEEMMYPELKPVITSFTNMYQRYEKSLDKSLNKKETV